MYVHLLHFVSVVLLFCILRTGTAVPGRTPDWQNV